MKKVIFLSIIVFILATVSCSKKDNNSGFPTLPNTWMWAWPQFGINKLLFILQGEVEGENYVNIQILNFTDEVPQNCELKINDQTIAVPDTSEWNETYWYGVYHLYFYLIDSEDVPELASLHAGDLVNYSLKINNKTDAGSLKITCQPNCTFPEFDVEQDYNYSWNIQESPDLYYVTFYIKDNISTNEIYQKWKLNGSEREDLISKSMYQDFIGAEDLFVWLELDVLNYERYNEFMALSEKLDEYEEGESSRKVYDRESHRDRLLKALFDDIDNL